MRTAIGREHDFARIASPARQCAEPGRWGGSVVSSPVGGDNIR